MAALEEFTNSTPIVPKMGHAHIDDLGNKTALRTLLSQAWWYLLAHQVRVKEIQED